MYAIVKSHVNCLILSKICKADNPNLEWFPYKDCFLKLKKGVERKLMHIIGTLQEHMKLPFVDRCET